MTVGRWRSVCVFSAAACLRLLWADCARHHLPTQICAVAPLIFHTSASTKKKKKNCLWWKTWPAAARNYRCFIAAAEFTCWHSFQERSSSPALGCSQVRSGCERETQQNCNSSVNEELLDSEESVSSKDQTVKFYFTSLYSCAVCWRISSWFIRRWLCLSFGFSSGWQKLVNSSPWNEVLIEEWSTCPVKSTLCLSSSWSFPVVYGHVYYTSFSHSDLLAFHWH